MQMLKEARRLKEIEHVDVVAGLVETHSRRETEACLDGLEVIPRRVVVHHGIELSEMDVPAILARKPQVVPVRSTRSAMRMSKSCSMPESM